MVRPADYVYGVVPKRGGYGFESQPSSDDPSVLSRVQSLTSSFQWSATASDDAEAIAVDRSNPPLVAHFVTDPRDPDGRRSLCMRVWITSETETLQSIIAEIWPGSGTLPIPKGEFLLAAAQQTSGRIIVGPNDSFTAVGFSSSWGTQATAPKTATSPAQRLSTRPNADPPPYKTRGSSLMLKAFTTLCVLALVATAGFALLQYREVERLQTEVNRFSRDAEDAAGVRNLIEQQLEEVKNSNQKKSIEIATQTRELLQLRSDAERLKSHVAERDKIIAANPEKVDQVELAALRSFKASVEEYIDLQQRSLKGLTDAVPQTPSKYNGFADRVKDVLKGKSSNE
jgi:hypothetical protein